MIRQPKARIIVPVWGEYHAKEVFAKAGLRSLLAPGNLPHLAKHLDCELLILTETRLMAFFDDLSVIARLRDHVTVSYRSIDDLLGLSDYSVPLTLALFRGLEGLGPAITETYLFFLNADFVLADGSYRTVSVKIAAGETLILAPSIRAAAETTLPILAAAVLPADEAVVLAPRALVRVLIENLHPMPRAKIVNRPFCHPHRIDQFYWLAGTDALIGHQFPMALVCVKPDSIPPVEPPCFFDYCAIPVLAPNARRCVLSDSDEYFMIELQPSRTGVDQLKPGWPTSGAIAIDLGAWTTAEQRELGARSLFIHAGDISSIDQGHRDEARRFIEALLMALPARAQSHVDHPFWLPAHAHFLQARREQETTRDRGENGASGGAGRDAGAARRRSPTSVFGLVNALRRVAHALLGRAPYYHLAHPLSPYYRDTVLELGRELACNAYDCLALSPKGSVFRRIFAGRAEARIVEYDPLIDASDNIFSRLGPAATSGERPALMFIELAHLDLEIADRVRAFAPAALPRGSVVLVYFDRKQANGFLRDPVAISQLLDAMVPRGATGSLRFLGSAVSRLGEILIERMITDFYSGRKISFFACGLALATLAPIVVIENLLSTRRYRGAPGRFSSRILLKFILP